MKQRPLIFILFAYLAGLGINTLFSPPTPYLLISALLLSLAGILIYYIKSNNQQRAVLIILIAIIFWAGWWQQVSTLKLSSQHVSSFANAQKYLIKGKVLEPPREYGYKKQFILAIDQLTSKKLQNISKTVTGKVQVNCYIPDIDIEYNDHLQFWARLRPPPGSNNPGVFNYRDYLARRGIRATASLSSTKQLIKHNKVKGNWLFRNIYKLKTKLSQFLRKETSQPQQGILRTILLGEKGPLLPTIREQFAKSGTAHLLAISGLHLSFITLLIFQFIRRGLLYSLSPFYLEKLGKYAKPSQFAALVTLPCLIFYVLLVGTRTATIRALIMIGAYLISLILERERNLYNILALAALVILIWQPSALQEVDFQLSFGIVFFLITAIETVPRPKAIPFRLFHFLLIPTIASLAALPLTATHFQQISTVGFIANIVTVPIVSLVIPLGLLASFTSLLSSALGAMLLAPSQWLLKFLILPMTESFTQIPSASIHVFPPTAGQIMIFYLALYTFLKAFQSRLARRSLGILLIGAGFIFWQPYPQHANKNLRVTYLDVGQGESSFIEFPNGKTMLIDGGGTSSGYFDIGAKIVAPFLRYKRIKRIDTVVLTHPHPDHLNGLKNILQDFEVGEIWESKRPKKGQWKEYESTSYQRFKSIAAKKQIPQRQLGAREEFIIGKAQIKIMHPPTKGFISNINDQSLILKLTYNQVSFLFTGDIGKRAQKYLVKSYAKKLRSTILKAPHHGGADAYLPKFLTLVNPEVSVFSVGLYNKYRHPNKKALKAYHKQGIKTYRTDYQGAITITTDGLDYRVSPFVNKPPASNKLDNFSS